MKQRWPGGYILTQKDGRPLFIIERRVDKRRYHLSTRTHTITAALKQLERFEANPAGYSPAGDDFVDNLQLTAELLLDYREYMLHEKRNVRPYVNEVCNRLKDWMVDLSGVDLRRMTLRDHIAPALMRRKTCRKIRIIALKAFMTWLRKVKHLLTHREDATLDLSIPQGTPEQWRRRKAVNRTHALKAIAALKGHPRDCMVLLVGTGWHTTELSRFIRSKDSQIIIPRGAEQQRAKARQIIAVLVTRHKGGEPTRTPICHKEHLEAAQRLKQYGRMPKKLNMTLKAACRAVRVPEFTAGVMRHSVATWAIEDGAAPSDVSQFLQHKDKRTTTRFYADAVVPSVAIPVLRLVS